MRRMRYTTSTPLLVYSGEHSYAITLVGWHDNLPRVLSGYGTTVHLSLWLNYAKEAESIL